MADLTDEAKAEIADAVRIVREDKFEGWFKGKFGAPKDPPPGPNPPPTADPPKDPPKKRGLWWNEDEPKPADAGGS